MPNQRYNPIAPKEDVKEKKMGPGMKNDDGREKGSEYNTVSKASATFKETVNPNDSVKKLGSVDGVAEA